jgi:hypothetical protein
MRVSFAVWHPRVRNRQTGIRTSGDNAIRPETGKSCTSLREGDARATPVKALEGEDPVYDSGEGQGSGGGSGNSPPCPPNPAPHPKTTGVFVPIVAISRRWTGGAAIGRVSPIAAWNALDGVKASGCGDAVPDASPMAAIQTLPRASHMVRNGVPRPFTRRTYRRNRTSCNQIQNLKGWRCGLSGGGGANRLSMPASIGSAEMRSDKI